jgi:Ion channel
MLKKYFQRYAKFVNDMNKMWITGGYMMFALLITICFIYMPRLSETHQGILAMFNIIMVGLPMLITISNIISFKTTMSSLRKLASLYLQIILMFGVIYYFATASNTAKSINQKTSYHAAITGIDTDWVKMAKQNGDKITILKEALISFQDSIHFSLITSTTVGYGDSVPDNPAAKLLVDIQVLVSCFLIAFGVGSFFNSDKTEIENRLTSIEQKLDEIIKNDP